MAHSSGVSRVGGCYVEAKTPASLARGAWGDIARGVDVPRALRAAAWHRASDQALYQAKHEGRNRVVMAA
jgi:hypothetical protein